MVFYDLSYFVTVASDDQKRQLDESIRRCHLVTIACDDLGDVFCTVPPRWKVEPRDSSVVLGYNVIIDCQSDGDPAPVVTWKKGLCFNLTYRQKYLVIF